MLLTEGADVIWIQISVDGNRQFVKGKWHASHSRIRIRETLVINIECSKE